MPGYMVNLYEYCVTMIAMRVESEGNLVGSVPSPHLRMVLGLSELSLDCLPALCQTIHPASLVCMRVLMCVCIFVSKLESNKCCYGSGEAGTHVYFGKTVRGQLLGKSLVASQNGEPRATTQHNLYPWKRSPKSGEQGSQYILVNQLIAF